MEDHDLPAQEDKVRKEKLFIKSVKLLAKVFKLKFLLASLIPIIVFVASLFKDYFPPIKDTIDLVMLLSSSKNLSVPTQQPTPSFVASSATINAPLEKQKVLGIAQSPCNGAPVDVLAYMSDVGKENLRSVDASDSAVVAAPDVPGYQGTKRYPFQCSLPWTADLSLTPLSDTVVGGKSLGVFLEFEGVFKLLLGDGDLVTWRLEKNDQGKRSTWTFVDRQKLQHGKISMDREVTLEITARSEAQWINLTFRIHYVPIGSNDYIWEEYHKKFEPLAVDLVANPSAAFRIGINDSRYKGLGSEVRFGTFSVKTIN